MRLPKPNENWDSYEGMQFAAGQELGLNAYGIHMRRRTFDGGWEYVKAVELTTETVDPGISVMPPILLSEDEAQGLMNALWMAGLRPRSGEGHTSHIQALNKHLEDMRKIAFHQLQIK